jgi:hypothetical protein
MQDFLARLARRRPGARKDARKDLLRFVAGPLSSLPRFAACSRGFLVPFLRVQSCRLADCCGGLESRYPSLADRGFESLPLRSTKRCAPGRRTASGMRRFRRPQPPVRWSPRRSTEIHWFAPSLANNWRTAELERRPGPRLPGVSTQARALGVSPRFTGVRSASAQLPVTAASGTSSATTTARLKSSARHRTSPTNPARPRLACAERVWSADRL